MNGRREEPGGSRSQRAGLSSERSFGKRPGRQAVGEMVAHRCGEGAALMHLPTAKGTGQCGPPERGDGSHCRTAEPWRERWLSHDRRDLG